MTYPTHAHVEAVEPARIEPDELFENDPERDRQLPKRRLARERVMQMLYANELGGGELDAMFVELIEHDLSEADKRSGIIANSPPDMRESSEGALEFARALTREFTLHREEIDRIITEKLQRWEFSRVALIDRILIQLGIVELLYFPDIPPKATINELIEIAKDFSTDESGKFINGLLHAIMTHLRETGELKKSGRGLLEEGQGGYRPASGHRKS